jgi:hypothetical protein
MCRGIKRSYSQSQLNGIDSLSPLSSKKLTNVKDSIIPDLLKENKVEKDTVNFAYKPFIYENTEAYKLDLLKKKFIITQLLKKFANNQLI